MRRNIIIIGVLSLGTMGGLAFIYSHQPKMAYVRLGYLYDNFDCKKDLEVKLSSVVNSRNAIIDSMEIHLKALANEIEDKGKKDQSELKQFEEEKQLFLNKKKQFEEDDQNMTDRYKEQINKQLSQYVKDYGTANGYAYIFGAEGGGSIMSADEKFDITTTVLQYVNERYKGKN